MRLAQSEAVNMPSHCLIATRGVTLARVPFSQQPSCLTALVGPGLAACTGDGQQPFTESGARVACAPAWRVGFTHAVQSCSTTRDWSCLQPLASTVTERPPSQWGRATVLRP